jgi:hypothetical protein
VEIFSYALLLLLLLLLLPSIHFPTYIITKSFRSVLLWLLAHVLNSEMILFG